MGIRKAVIVLVGVIGLTMAVGGAPSAWASVPSSGGPGGPPPGTIGSGVVDIIFSPNKPPPCGVQLPCRASQILDIVFTPPRPACPARPCDALSSGEGGGFTGAGVPSS